MTRYSNVMMNTFGPPQRVLVKGEGLYVWDDAGNKYLDLLGGIAVNALGHGDAALIHAVTDQLSTLGHVSNFFASEPQMALAEKLLELLGHDGKVFFTNSGAEANEAGFKLTRLTKRTKIIAAENSFHGRTMGALALTHKLAYREPFLPLPGEVEFVPFGDSVALINAVDENTAAILLEPIQGEAGVVDAPDGYLQLARELADKNGALLWFDEVQTGVGRTGAWFAYQHQQVVPDIVTLAKGLGGGLPIGACVALGPAADLFHPGSHGSTFGGNPVATRAGLTVLNEIAQRNLLSNAIELGDYLRAGVSSHVKATTGKGLLIGLVLQTENAAAVQTRLLENGVIVNAPRPDRLRLAPALTIDKTHADEAIAAINQAIEECAK